MSEHRARLVILAAIRIAAAAVGALFFFQSLEGCASDTLVGTPDAGVFDGGEAGGNPATDCSECIAETCTGQWSACFQSTDCVALLSCVEAPNCDATCRAACACASPSGVALFAAATACDQGGRCGSGSCNASCASANLTANCDETAPTCATNPPPNTTDAGSDGGEDGGSEASAPTAATCASCIAGSCSDQKAQCPPSSDCDAYLACAIACASASCISNCATTYATGNHAATEFAQCVTLSCPSQCGL